MDTSEKIYPLLKHRSSMTMAAGRLLFTSEPDEEAIIANSRQVGFKLRPRRSFCVRVRRFKGAHPELSRSKLEREVGSAIVGNASGRIQVDLHSPDSLLIGVITDGAFILGEARTVIDRGAYDRRRPRRRPYFMPGVLEPRIARVFVNLSQIDCSKVFYDPYMGTGGFVVEACMIGRYAVGSDVDLRMVKGGKSNLVHYNFANFDVIHADATALPLRRVECVGFDPPYGRATSTRRRRTEDLILSSLQEIAEILPRGRYVSLAFPSQIQIERKLPGDMFRVVEKHSMRVHRSLTRDILVLRRN